MSDTRLHLERAPGVPSEAACALRHRDAGHARGSCWRRALERGRLPPHRSPARHRSPHGLTRLTHIRCLWAFYRCTTDVIAKARRRRAHEALLSSAYALSVARGSPFSFVFGSPHLYARC